MTRFQLQLLFVCLLHGFCLWRRSAATYSSTCTASVSRLFAWAVESNCSPEVLLLRRWRRRTGGQGGNSELLCLSSIICSQRHNTQEHSRPLRLAASLKEQRSRQGHTARRDGSLHARFPAAVQMNETSALRKCNLETVLALAELCVVLCCVVFMGRCFSL